jgi:FtsP/CotA-like multicopper oxidase with cupredoxin domain
VVKQRLFIGVCVVLALLWSGGASGVGLAAGKAPAKRDFSCRPPAATREIVEPPDIETWNLPVDASGERELILAVYKDSQRYCYRYTWNGQEHNVAPTIRVRRGEHFAIRIVNDLAGPARGAHIASTAIPPCTPMMMPAAPAVQHAGYLNHTIEDRYTHGSRVDTNLHLHGFEGPAVDENVFLSTLSTPMHACEFHVTIPATQPPGTYLYHPHAHGTADDQVGFGLDGVWIVEPDQPQIARSADHVILLRYRIPIVLDSVFAPSDDPFVADAVAHEAARPLGSPVPYDPFNPPPWPVNFPMKIGDVSLDPTGCNGAGSDVHLALDGSDAPAQLEVTPGQPQLLRIANGTSDTGTRLQLRDANGGRRPLQVVGLDGVPVSGDMEHPLSQYIAINDLMTTSMSRTDILVTLDPGTMLTLSAEHFCEGKDGFYQGHRDLLQIKAGPAAAAATALQSRPAVIADTPAAKLVAFAKANPSLVHRRALTFTEYAFAKHKKTPFHYGYFVTDTTNPNFHEHQFSPVYASGKAFPTNADVTVKRGSVEEWYLINASMESHAFHMHQMAFVIEKGSGGIPLTVDTAFLPVGKLLPNRHDPNYPLIKPTITKLLLDFRNVPRGTFVFHCHMLFHEDAGMMAIIKVV